MMVCLNAFVSASICLACDIAGLFISSSCHQLLMVTWMMLCLRMSWSTCHRGRGRRLSDMLCLFWRLRNVCTGTSAYTDFTAVSTSLWVKLYRILFSCHTDDCICSLDYLLSHRSLMPVSHRAYGLYGQARTVNVYGHPKTRGPAGVSSFVASQRCLSFECWRQYEASTVKPGFYKP